MLRWAVRLALVGAVLFVARAHGDFFAVTLGYALWGYLVWRAWPALVADVRWLWGRGVPLRESLRKTTVLRSDANSGF